MRADRGHRKALGIDKNRIEPCQVTTEGADSQIAKVIPRMCLPAISEPCQVTAEGADPQQVEVMPPAASEPPALVDAVQPAASGRSSEPAASQPPLPPPASSPAPSEPPTPRMCLSANSEPCEVPAEGADLVAVEVCGLTADGASAVQVATGGDSDAGPVLGLLATPAKPTAAAAVSEDAASEDAAYDKACEAEDDDDVWGVEGVDWHWTGQGCFRFDRFDSMYTYMISIRFRFDLLYIFYHLYIYISYIKYILNL